MRFFRFPSNGPQLDAWIKTACPRRQLGWQPSPHMRICSEHFVSGRPSKDNSDIDWIPSIIDLRKGSREVGERAKQRHERLKRRSNFPATDVPPPKASRPMTTESILTEKASSIDATTPQAGEDSGEERERRSYEDICKENRELRAECEYLHSLEDRLSVLEEEVLHLTAFKRGVKNIADSDEKSTRDCLLLSSSWLYSSTWRTKQEG